MGLYAGKASYAVARQGLRYAKTVHAAIIAQLQIQDLWDASMCQTAYVKQEKDALAQTAIISKTAASSGLSAIRYLCFAETAVF